MRERRYLVDDAQLSRAIAQLSKVGATWDARLRRIKKIAEAIERSQLSDKAQPSKKNGRDHG
jgi:hypothetical protein